MDIPLRYLRYFVVQHERVGYHTERRPERWICKLCGQSLQPNNAGAQSHISRHLKEVNSGSVRLYPSNTCRSVNDMEM